MKDSAPTPDHTGKQKNPNPAFVCDIIELALGHQRWEVKSENMDKVFEKFIIYPNKPPSSDGAEGKQPETEALEFRQFLKTQEGKEYTKWFFCEDEEGKVMMQKAIEIAKSQSSTVAEISNDVATKLLAIRDALILKNIDEAYHQLYSIASPNFDKKQEDVWKDLEAIADGEPVQSRMIQLLRWFEVEKEALRIDGRKGYDELVQDFLARRTKA